MDEKNVLTVQGGNAQGKDASAAVRQGEAKKSKRGLIAMIVLAMIALGGVGFGIYGLVAGSSRVAELEKQLAEKDETISELEQNDDGNEGTANDLAQRLLITTPEQLIGGDGKPVEVELRASFGSSVQITLSKQIGGEMELFDGSKINKEPSLRGRISGNFAGDDKNEEFEVTGIDAGKVVDVFISGFGNGTGYETAFFLMEDGTVEYIPLVKAYEEKNYQSYGKLPGVENVIKFLSGEIYDGGPYGALVGAFAQRADGKLYRLLDVVRETGYY